MNPLVDPRTAAAFRRMIRERIALKPEEQVLIVADNSTEMAVLDGLLVAINEVGAIGTVIVQPDTGFDPENVYALTRPVSQAFMGADVVIAATRSSGSSVYGRPQEFRDKLNRADGVRMFAIIERPLEVLLSDTADYTVMRQNNERMKTMLSKGKEIHITAKGGTDFRGSCEGVPFEKLWHHLSHEGQVVNQGDFGAYPDGEVHWPCPPASMEGLLVVDGPVANICSRPPDEPIRIKVKAGRILSIEGGRDAADLRALVKRLDQEWISEIGLGTNPSVTGNVIHIAKKTLGNLHVAYGGWWGFQPDIPYKIHGDMVIRDGKVEIDGKVVMAEGRLFPEG
jgi:leucyl aminopeptidase (aminopeptidase T)